MRKTDEELERDLAEAIRPLLKKWDDDYIEGMKALGYTEQQAWAIVGRRMPNAPAQPDLFT